MLVVAASDFLYQSNEDFQFCVIVLTMQCSCQHDVMHDNMLIANKAEDYIYIFIH